MALFIAEHLFPEDLISVDNVYTLCESDKDTFLKCLCDKAYEKSKILYKSLYELWESGSEQKLMFDIFAEKCTGIPDPRCVYIFRKCIHDASFHMPYTVDISDNFAIKYTLAAKAFLKQLSEEKEEMETSSHQ